MLEVRAWAYDPNAPTAPATVRVYVGGRPGDPAAELHTFSASASRADVGVLHPEAGSAHGVDETFTTAARGDQAVCVSVDNAGPGHEMQLGCKAVRIDGSDVPKPGVPSGTALVVGGSAQLNWKVAYEWLVRGDVTRLKRLRVIFTGSAAGVTVAVSCRASSTKGSRCPFRRRAFKPSRGIVNLKRALSKPLPPRTVILLTVMRGGKPVGNSVRLVTRVGAGPVLTRVKPSSHG
jgi:hypothetical protein